MDKESNNDASDIGDLNQLDGSFQHKDKLATALRAPRKTHSHEALLIKFTYLNSSPTNTDEMP